MNRRTFLKLIPTSLLAVSIPAIFLKQEERVAKVTSGTIDNRMPVQLFTLHDSEIVEQTNHLNTWKIITIQTPIEYVICNLGDKVCVINNYKKSYEGFIRRIEPISSNHSLITIVNPIYAKRIIVVRDGKVVEVYA